MRWAAIGQKGHTHQDAAQVPVHPPEKVQVRLAQEVDNKVDVAGSLPAGLQDKAQLPVGQAVAVDKIQVAMI